MKIAMVVLGGLHPSGTVEIVPSWLALFGQLARSHDVHAFVLRHLETAQTYSLRGFTVHDLGRPSAPLGLTRQVTERALRRALEAHGPFDVIHGFWADPAGQLAARAGNDLGIPTVVTCDGGEFVSLPDIDYGSQRTARGRRAVAEACALATRIHVCTDFMAALARQYGHDATVISLASMTAAGFSHRRAAANGALRLIQVGSLSRVKNQRLLLDALAVVRRHREAHLDLVGEDTLDGTLQRHRHAVGVESSVTFHGFRPHANVRDLLVSADLYVQSSRHEAAGVSVLEAATVGLPIVGTRVGYVADWSPARAAAVDLAAPESLAAAILDLAEHHDRRQALAAGAQAWAVAHDVTACAAEFDSLYRSLR